VYDGGQFYWWSKMEYPESPTDLPSLKLYHIRLHPVLNVKNRHWAHKHLFIFRITHMWYCKWTLSGRSSRQCIRSSLSVTVLNILIYNRRGVFDTTLCDIVCQWFAAGRWFSPGTPISSTNKTDRHDIT